MITSLLYHFSIIICLPYSRRLAIRSYPFLVHFGQAFLRRLVLDGVRVVSGILARSAAAWREEHGIRHLQQLVYLNLGLQVLMVINI